MEYLYVVVVVNLCMNTKPASIANQYNYVCLCVRVSAIDSLGSYSYSGHLGSVQCSYKNYKEPV